MKKLYFLLIITFVCSANAQIVNIPDANFKAKLLSASATNEVALNLNFISTPVDLNNDGEIQVTEAEAIKYLNVDNSNITDLTGIETFTNLQYLHCSINQLSFLNVSNLLNLRYLNCSTNQLLNLNVSSLINLQELFCEENILQNLNILNLINLEYLYVSSNQLVNLDVSSLTNLQDLKCYGNLLQSLNVTGLSNLQFLDCSDNQLVNLDVSSLSDLQILNCSINQLQSLDVSSLTNLSGLFCYANQLTHLNIKNNNINWDFNNSGINGDSLSFFENTNLQYICADEEDITMVQQKIINSGYTSFCNLNSYCSFSPGGTFYVFNGNNRFDSNNSCEITDTNYPNLIFLIANEMSFRTYIANSSGSYSIPVSEGNHTITPNVQNPSYFNISPTSVTASFPSQASPLLQDFCITPNGTHSDVQISLIPIGVARPGFNATYKLVYKNVGNQLENGSIIFTSSNSDVIDFVSSVPVFTTQNEITN